MTDRIFAYSRWSFPMREVDIAEFSQFMRWHIFGENSLIADIDQEDGGEIAVCIPIGKAKRIVEARDRFVSEVVAVLNED